MESYHVGAYHRIYRIASSRITSHDSNERSYIKHIYARNVYQSIPESVVSPGIALAISAMAFPSCCILAIDTVGADVGIDVGADVGINVEAEIKVLDIDHYFIVCNSLDYPRYHISAFIR